MPYAQGYTVNGDAYNASQEAVAGYALTNVAIFNGLTSAASITDGVAGRTGDVDKCGTSSTPIVAGVGGAPATGGQMNYHSLSICMQPSTWTSTT